MSHLLAISIGPVQDFIAAARKTRDLLNGSELLSTIATAIAQALGGCGELVFPASGAGSAPNKIVCLVEGDPAEAASKAHAAAQAAFDEAVDAAVKQVNEARVADCFDRETLRAQCEEFLEFYAAWVPVGPEGYAAARERCEALLAGRKGLRDFAQPTWAKGRPKSSLDGGRDTVIAEDATDEQLGRLSIKRTEQLDGVSVVKRLLDKGEARFPSVVRVAADPFWRSLPPERLEAVRAFAGDHQAGDLIQRLKGDAAALYSDFPWDIDPSLWHEGGEAPCDLVKGFRCAVDQGQPGPYYTILAADGDRMGQALSRLTSKEAHQRFSAQLAEFAGRARGIVTEQRGALVYAGGDDVLAFLPMDKALRCARELREAFDKVAEGLGLDETPTLSVGIAIVHIHENLRTALEFARSAERAAKNGGRNALAIARHTRGMGPDAPTVVRSWTNQPVESYEQYGEWIRDGILPSGFAYEIRALARELDGIDLRGLAGLAGGEFERILKRKQVPKERIADVMQRLLADLAALGGASPVSLRALSDSLIIAKHLAPAKGGGLR